jgi:hypothetical protein
VVSNSDAVPVIAYSLPLAGSKGSDAQKVIITQWGAASWDGGDGESLPSPPA